MPRNPRPILPRRLDERAYNRDLRRLILDLMYGRLRSRLALAAATSQALHEVDNVLGEMMANPQRWLSTATIQKHLNNMESYHRRRLFATFRAALGVDIRPYLTQPQVQAFMQNRLADNVDLVRSVPQRSHDGLRQRIAQEFADAPFDQQGLSRMLREQYRVDGYVLRRLSRDQTNKAIGGLTEIRQTQLGITHYEWSSSQDERVRPVHQDYDGQTFAWANPPSEGHPGQPIQCRCTAQAIVDTALRQRLGARR